MAHHGIKTAMVASILVPLLVFVVGVLVYALASNPKLARIGEIGAWVGLFWLVGMFAKEVIRF